MRRANEDNNLVLGSNVIETVLPFKRPLLMVDGILSYRRHPEPRIRAFRHISANESIFDGHFPDVHLWPGIYTQEGLGQSGAMLKTILGLQQGWEDNGGDPDEVLEALRNLERGFKLHPGFQPEAAGEFRRILTRRRLTMEMTSAVEMKFLRPVFAGQRLDFDVTIVKEFDKMLRLAVEAGVAGEPVARGTITATIAFLRPVEFGGE